MTSPFIKWVGGKRQLLPELRARVPSKFGRYFEPFVGGGALFFDLAPGRAVLSDANKHLIATYRGVRDDVDGVIARLRESPYDEAFYYRLRAYGFDAKSDAEAAARFIYLNKTCFNGLYRENKAGKFNASFGRYTNPTICDEEALRACSAVLKEAHIAVSDFEAAVSDAEAGDFVYFDPPYVPLTATSNFTSYTLGGFTHADQVRLRDVALTLKASGVHVLLSNSSAEAVRDLYSDGFVVEEVSARRAVNSKASGRGAVKELVIS